MDAPSFLSEIGIQKEVNQLKLELDSAINTRKHLLDSINENISKLTNIGCLSTGIRRGYIDNFIDFIDAKSLGLIKRNNNSVSSLGRILVPSTSLISQKLATRFKKLWTISGHMGNPAYCCVFDRKGRFLLSGADDYLVKIWDVTRGQLVRTCRGHSTYVTYIAISPDNSLFASSCLFGTIRIWRLSDGKCLQVLKHNKAVNWMKFDDLTSSLASAGDDGQCIVWDISKLILEEDVYVPTFDILYNEKDRLYDSNKLIHPQPSITNVRTSHDSVAVTFEFTTSSDDIDKVRSLPLNSERIGLFAWSKEKQLEIGIRTVKTDCLLLPHMYSTSSENHQRVKCLDISAVAGIVVTGCEDGVARIWRFNDDYDEITKHKVDKQLRQIEATKGEVGHQLYRITKTTAKHLLTRLEGHVSPVTDIHINKMGDRILTASSDDGNVRIWSFSRSYTKHTHIVLNLHEEEEETAQVFQNHQARGRGGNASKARSKLQVYNVCWNYDNTRVITIQSVPMPAKLARTGKLEIPYSSRLKVWDSMNGDLLRVIWNVSNATCTCLVPHPLDSSLVLTSGEDGLVNIWNLDQESNMCSIKIVNDDGTPSTIADANISPDGTFIAITDGVGRVSLIGLDEPNRYSNVLTEQYFSTDYSNVLLDDRGFAIDAGTQLPVHESPVGYLCKIDHTPYFQQPTSYSFPTTLSRKEVEYNQERIYDLKNLSLVECDRVFSIFSLNVARNRVPKKYKNFKTRSNLDQNNMLQSPGTAPRNNISSLQDFVYESSSDDSDDDSDFDEIIQTNTHNTRNHQPVQRTRRLARANSASANLRRSRRSRYEPTSYSDEVDLEEIDRAIEYRTGRPNRRKKTKRTIVVDDDSEVHCFSDENEEDNSGTKESDSVVTMDDSDNSEKRIKSRRNNSDNSDQPDRLKNRRGGIKKKKTVIDVDDELLYDESSPLKKSKDLMKKIKWNEISIPIGNEVDRKWLQVDTINDQEYVPQMGDKVIYFSQGHKEILQIFAENSSPPWHIFPQKFPLVECEIIDISYAFPSKQQYHMCPSVIVIVKLLIISIPSKIMLHSNGLISVGLASPRATRNSSNNDTAFSVKLRKYNLPDFLVPSHLFERAIRLPWYEGMKIQIKYQDIGVGGETIQSTSNGRVAKVSTKEEEWQHSPWECLEVEFDNGPDQPISVDRICPWEVIPIFDDSSNYWKMWNSFVSPQINEDRRKKIQQGIEDLMSEESVFKPFFDEVDPIIFPDYYCFIHVPIYLSLIYKRVVNKYYRQVSMTILDNPFYYRNIIILYEG